MIHDIEGWTGPACAVSSRPVGELGLGGEFCPGEKHHLRYCVENELERIQDVCGRLIWQLL